jgi:AcrR family transcriptional regulator
LDFLLVRGSRQTGRAKRMIYPFDRSARRMNYPVMLTQVTSTPLRKDAAQNWQRIVEVGRRSVDQGIPLQLNDVAKAAGVGVATVYRHFPTPQALLETVAAPGLEALAAHNERALTDTDRWTAFRDFLLAAAHAQITDPSISAVMAAPDNALPSTAELKQRLSGLFGQLLDQVHAAGLVDASVTTADLAPLMCGVAFAARVHPADSVEERAATARRYLFILLEGLRSREDRVPPGDR